MSTNGPPIDIEANRKAQKWTLREQLGRVLWALAMPLFRFSPRPFWGWRCLLLRLFGAKVGKDVHIYPTVRIKIPWNLTLGNGCAVGDHAILYALGPIRVGERTTVSQYAHLCAGSHEWRDPAMPLIKPPIVVGSDVWVCAEVFVGPGVVVGDRAILAARAVVVREVPGGEIFAGNPAQRIAVRDA